MSKVFDPFGARAALPGTGLSFYGLEALQNYGDIQRLPFSIRILLEALLRNCDDNIISRDDVIQLAGWSAEDPAQVEIPFKPARVILQDFTGVPAVVDLAALRSAMARMGGDPQKINPVVMHKICTYIPMVWKATKKNHAGS